VSNWQYTIGMVLALLALAAVLVTPFFLNHARTEHDHGPGCWWCRPGLLRRKRR